MNCSECNSDNDAVMDSRKIIGRVWRRRKCLDCGNKWTTWEEREKITKFEQYCEQVGCKRPVKKKLCDVHSKKVAKIEEIWMPDSKEVKNNERSNLSLL